MVQGILGKVAQFGPECKKSYSVALPSQLVTDLQELNDRAGEGEGGRLLLHVLRAELVLHHELGQVTHNLAAWGHLILLDILMD